VIKETYPNNQKSRFLIRNWISLKGGKDISVLPSANLADRPAIRIARDAITNIIRHAKATHASVVMLRQPHEITMLVEDNGQGFDLAVTQSKGDQCLGLMGMKESANLLGGSFVVESVPREGTTIGLEYSLLRTSMPVRIFIADDHAVFRSSLRVLLEKEPDLEVVGESGNGFDTIRAISETELDVLLLDVTMPGLTGARVAEEVLKRNRIWRSLYSQCMRMNTTPGILPVGRSCIRA